jgi:hypothetical protein
MRLNAFTGLVDNYTSLYEAKILTSAPDQKARVVVKRRLDFKSYRFDLQGASEKAIRGYRKSWW